MSRVRTLALASCVLVAAAGLHAGFGGFDLGDLTREAKDISKMAKGVAGIGPEEERVIGGSVAVEIVGAYGGLVRDNAIMRRVNLIGRTLAESSDRPDLAWRFGVLNSDTVNAFSAPGGYVFITRGLYAITANDDQLAGVLAHEIAHVTKRHALKIVARGEFLEGASDLAAEQNSDVRAAQAQLQRFDLGINKIMNTLFKTGFDPKTEYEADAVGRDLATVAGYSRNGLKDVLQQLQRDHLAASKEVFPTHPPLAQRIRRL